MITTIKSSLLISSTMIVIAGLNACSGGMENSDQGNAKPVAVTLSAASASGQSEILASGKVEAVQTVNVSTRVMGRITSILVKVGDRVQKGQLLARVWDEDMKAKRAQASALIAEAEAAFGSAQKDFDRFNSLYKQQSATAKELDNATLQYNAARSRLTAAKEIKSEVNANISYSSVTAPFSGVVTQKLTEEGSVANPGMPILTIEQDGILQISASIAESDITDTHLGDVAHITIKATRKAFDGKIIQINPSSQFTGGQYIVKISIPLSEKKDVYAGMFANVNISNNRVQRVKNDVVLVPSSVIINRDELSGIYTVSSNNTALLRWIRLGKNYGDKVEVLSGLSKDEKFISSSESKLYNGAPVAVKQMREESVVTFNK